VKVLAEAAGYAPRLYAGHSLRRGLIIAAVKAGARGADVMRHSRHKSIPVFRRYVESASVFEANPAMAVGL
jgi:hypothetical protein